jgi:hypothetical protein
VIRLGREIEEGQARGEVAGRGGDRGNQHTGGKLLDGKVATFDNLGVSYKQAHDWKRAAKAGSG